MRNRVGLVLRYVHINSYSTSYSFDVRIVWRKRESPIAVHCESQVMPSIITCPHCNTSLKAERVFHAGTVVPCPTCQREFTIQVTVDPNDAVGSLQPNATPNQASPLYQAPNVGVAPSNAIPSEPAANQNAALGYGASTATSVPAKPAAMPHGGSASGGKMIWIVAAGLGALMVLVIGVGVGVIVALRMTPGSQPVAAARPQSDSGTTEIVAGKSDNTTAVAAPSARGSAGTPATGNNDQVIQGQSKPIASLPALDAPTQWAYEPKNGIQYRYKYEVTSGSSDNQRRTYGTIRYDAKELPKSAITKAVGKSRQASGTAFVVHSDGLLVTCSHVVEGATKLDVQLGEIRYTGDIVGIDSANDLALIRIHAQDLPSIAIAPSQKIRLAEDVRAVGFPLSDVLGSSIKVTKGSIAGRIDQGASQLLQIDAAINPGNSGGPLIDARGNVVGVISSGLTGEVSNVGFAVPSEAVLNLLKSVGVTPDRAPSNSQLDGPTIAEQTSPAVAFVKVEMNQVDQLFAMEYGTIMHGGKVSSIGGFESVDGQVIATRNGLVLANEKETSLTSNGPGNLPFLLGPVGSMVFEKIPGGGENSWSSKRVTALTIRKRPTTRSVAESLLIRRRLPFPYERRQPSESIVVIPAIETTEYQIIKSNESQVTIQKKYEFRLQEETANGLEMKGSGEYVFNREDKMPQSLHFKGLCTVINDGTRTSLPFDYQYSLASKKTAAEVQAERDEARRRIEEANDPKSAKNQAKIDAFLALVEVEKFESKHYSIISEVWRAPLDESRLAEVSEALNQITLRTEGSIRTACFYALQKWGTKANLPMLRKALDMWPDYFGRIAERIAEIGGTKEDAENIAKRLTDKSSGFQAGQALKKMGPKVQEVLWPYLDAKDEKAAGYAIECLRTIGTGISLPKIGPLQNHPRLGSSAKLAISSIARRAQK